MGKKCATRARKGPESRAGPGIWKWSEVITTVRSASSGFFPLDRQLKLNDKNWSEGVAQWAVKYSAKMPYAEAQEALLELAQIEISTKSIWRLTQHWGAALKRVEAQEDERANGTVESQANGKLESKTGVRMGAAMDGTMIYIRGEAWKELKVGCFFEVEQAPTLDPETLDWIDLAHARKLSFVSHLGGPEPFGKKMWTESKRRSWQKAADTQVVSDGATWIWNLVSDYLYDAHQVIDWFHATEHLGAAANLAFGEGPSGLNPKNRNG